MAGITIPICLMMCALGQSVSFNVPPQTPFAAGTIQIKDATMTQTDKIQEKQDVIEEDMHDVNMTVNDILVRIEELEKRKDVSGSNSASVTQMDQQLDSIVSNQVKLTSDLSTLSKSVSKVEENMKEVNDLKEQVGSITRTNGEVASQLSELSKAVSSVDKKLEEVGKLEKQVGSFAASVEEVKSSLSSLSNDVSDVQENRREVDNLKKQMGSLSTLPETVVKMEEDLKQVSKLEGQVGTLTKANDEMTSQLSSLSKTVSNVEENTNGVNQLKKQVEPLTSLPESVDKVEEDLKQVDQQVGSLATANKKVTSEVSSLTETVRNVELGVKQVGDLRKQMESHAASQSRSVSQLSALSKNVDQIEAKVKEVDPIKVKVEEVRKANVATEKRVTSVNGTVYKIEHAIDKVKLGPKNCAEIKQCGDHNTDGEYWLYPDIFDGKRVKIYCHKMGTSSPVEYVTLPYPNKGDYPAKQRPRCEQENAGGRADLIGAVTFTKIRVDITTMEVKKDDVTFATLTRNHRPFGIAGDCYWTLSQIKSENKCGPAGFFTIDTRKTGLRVDDELTWKAEGWHAAGFYERRENGQVIHLSCGGYCGDCFPVGGKIPLEISPGEELGHDAATTVKCPIYEM